MKKSLQFLCLILLMACMSGFAQGPTTVTVGTGTNDSYNLPINNFYKNSWSEMIYPAYEITERGYITSIGFDVSAVPTSSYLCSTMTIYMGTIANDVHNSNADWLPMEALTEVWSAINWPLPTATGWLTFDLDNPFQYVGNDNLVIVISKTMPNYTNGLKFRYTEGAANCCLYRRSDSYADYANYPDGNSGTFTNQLPNLQLTFSSTIDFCHTVTNFTITDISAYEATFSWTAPENASNYIMQYKTEYEDWENGDVITVYPTETSYTITNLIPSTNYVARISNACDDGAYSGWRYTSFTTLCAPEATPYSEDFNVSNNIPNCWERFYGFVSDAFNGTNPTPTTSGWIFTNTHVFGEFHPKVNIYGSNCRYWLVSPAIDLSGLENPALIFEYALTRYNNDSPISDPNGQGDDRFLVLISTDGGVSWSADNAIEWNNTGSGNYVFNQIPAIGDEITISLERYAGQTIRIAFYGESTVSNGDNDLHIDNVIVGEVPTCPRPAQLYASNITTHSAEISWVETGTATCWVVEYGPSGFTPGSGTTINVCGEPTTVLYGLTPSTDYEFHVMADCGAGEFSYLKSSIFRTADCEAITLPYTEDFESYTTSATASTGIAPACWELMQEDAPMTEATRPQLYYKNTFAHSGDYSLKLHNRCVYAMGELDENIEMKYVHLEMYLRQPNAAYQLQVGVWEDVEGFVPVATFNNSTTEVTRVECDFSDYTGNGHRIAFRNVLGNGANYDYSHNYIDDITLSESALTPAPMPYYTDFSENSDQSWRLKNGTCTNYWMMGSPDENTPSALFITSDGSTAGYNINNGSTVMAEKAFLMPATEFVHVEFDVLVGGQGTYDYLKVFLTSVDDMFDAGTGLNVQSNYTYSDNALDFFAYKSLTGYTNYSYILNLTNGNTFHISAYMLNPDPNGTGKIVFLWRNNDWSGTQPGAVISNFSIEEIEGILPPTVSTGDISFFSANTATCGGYVTDNNGLNVTARGVCWSAVPEPTLEDAYTVNGSGLGEFTSQLTDLVQGTTYYVRAYATSLAGTAYGEEVSFTACDPILQLPYTEDFEFYTEDTTAATGIEPTCWELVQEDVPMSEENRPQLYYKSSYAHSGNYTLRLSYRGVYAMPRLDENTAMNHMHLEMYLRQTRTYYALEVGVWEDDGTFVPVATFNNTTTGTKRVVCDFSSYEGSGRRIAFRNVLGNDANYDYSYNYIDDIMLNDVSLMPEAIPYYTDFSENSDQNWRLENGSCTNYWTMSSPDENTPSALFITQDGSTAGYSITNGSTVMAEKAFLMPASDFVHVEFDVMVGGESSYDYLKVFLTPVDEMFAAGTNQNTQSRYSYSYYALDFSNYKPLTGNTNYPYILNLTNGNTLHVSANLLNPDPDGTGKIVFLWRNDNGGGTQPGVVISNFSIDDEAAVFPPTVATGYISNITTNSATCYSEVTDNGGVTITERGVCWSTAHNPTLENAYTYNGTGLGGFTSQLNNLSQGTTYYVRAYASNLAGTAYGEEIAFTTNCENLPFPYSEDFEAYTEDTTAATGVEPICWELVQEDVPMSDESRPQLYYKSSYAHSGNYTLRLNYRGVYAMPSLPDDISMQHVHLKMYLRQTRTYYALEVGVWEDDGTFVPVATFNNTTTGMKRVECDFSSYEGSGRRIAFHNILGGDEVHKYSYNYIDDITLTEAEGCEVTFAMHDSYGDGWNGNKILLHNDGTVKEITLTSGHDDTATVVVHSGSLEFEWVNGNYINECSFTVIGPSCLYYSGGAPGQGVFYATEVDCDNNNAIPAIPAFTYWTENTCSGVIVHLENESANAETFAWDFGDGVWSNEYSTVHEYTESGTYPVTLYVNNSTCEEFKTMTEEIEVITFGHVSIITLPYSEDFESYTESTTPATGERPCFWELVQEDVAMTDATRPQLYYKSAFAHSGDYSLKLYNRGVYAMPPLDEDIEVNQVHLKMYLRQPNAAYRLQVGVWEEEEGTFVPVTTINNSSTEVEQVECNFYEYTGNGRRIAFRNVLGNDASYTYSYNYLDDITLTFAIPAGDAQPCPGHETVTDYDGNIYNTVKIGEQCWMKENLRVTHYADGMEIPFADYNSLSYDLSYRYAPNGNESMDNISVYGYLYNWPAVMHGNASYDGNPSIIQGVCPQGWHIPSDAEWTQLTDYVSSVPSYICDGNSSYITKALASQSYWLNVSGTCRAGYDQQENNATGFSAVPASYVNEGGGGYNYFGYDASFWSCSQYNYSRGRSRRIWTEYTAEMYYDINLTKYIGLSVRCVLGEGYNLAAVTTNPPKNITWYDATCGGNVTYDGNTNVIERGVCWNTWSNPTIYDSRTIEGGGLGEFASHLTDLEPGVTYYVRAYVTNSMGTAYGNEVAFTTCGGTIALPYTEDFESYTESTTAATRIEPSCWELVQADVEMTDATRPQLYYKSAFAHSGDYSLKLYNRGVYAMPPIEENMAMKHVHLDMYLRQPTATYRLQVGVWDDETGTFTPVAMFDNSTSEVEHVECDFSNYTGNGRRVAFRNVLVSGTDIAYSYNYIDDITLTETEGCELTIEMHSQDWGWDGSLIRVHTDGSVKEVTLNNAYDGTATVTVHNGMLDLEWENYGWIPAEWISYTITGPCLYYSMESAPSESGFFYSAEIDCNGDNTTAIPEFGYWTENTCNGVLVHFENYSTDAEDVVWDFGDRSSSEEYSPTHEYTESNVYPVTLSVNNGSCDNFSIARTNIEVNVPEPITSWLDTAVCAAALPLYWHGQLVTNGETYSVVLQSASGCDSTVNMTFEVYSTILAHTPDTLVPANEPVTLWASGTGTLTWTDADGNVLGEGNSVTVIPTEATTYYVTSTENMTQGNLVVNGNFEQGNTGFTSDYNYAHWGNCQYYCIGHTFSDLWGWDVPFFDHTSNSGLFLMLDAYRDWKIWSQTVEVAPHTNYVFTAWFIVPSSESAAYDVCFVINNQAVKYFDIPYQGRWEKRSVVWNSGDNTTANLSISTQWADCGGYDFGIDDIKFFEISCAGTESVTVNLLPTGDAQPCPGTPTVSDIDGNVYNTVKIGNQCWMRENLKTTRFANGEEIVLGEETSLNTPYRYTPGFEWGQTFYVESYGYLYNWAAVMNGANSSSANPSGVQGICPNGWHVPSNAEWAQMTNYTSSVPAYQCSGSSDIAKALVFPEFWNGYSDECDPGYANENATGFNTTGFSARSAGSYNGNYSIHSHAAFWSSTQSGSRNAWGTMLFSDYSGVYRYYFGKASAFSVRCVYNEDIASVPTVETDDVTFVTPAYATCGGEVTDDGGANVIKRGVCWSAEHTPTVYDSHTSNGRGRGEFTSFLNNLMPGTTYFVRAYATNSMGTGYGQVLSFTTTTCEPITVPYLENFDEYTLSTTAATGIEPACWEMVQEDEQASASKRPQLYYKEDFAYSGSYSLKLHKLCVYAMPALAEDIQVNQLHLDMYLRQPSDVYGLQVGIWDEENGSFEPVATFHNSTTEVEHVECDFSSYTGNGNRIAFRNTLISGATIDYSINYIDEILLDYIPIPCGISELPYTENFDGYTTSTTAETGVQPRCWEVINEDVALTDATKPQVYYNANYATSGAYTLRLKNRCVYAMPELDENVNVSDLTMTFKLRQPNAVYRLQVGVVNEKGVFELVKTINNASTDMEDVTVNFSNYNVNGRRIAFRNTLGGSSTIDYSVNYIDDINLSFNNSAVMQKSEEIVNDAMSADRDMLDIVVYPNPTKDVVNVECTMNNVQGSMFNDQSSMDNVQGMGIEVIDVYGKVVRTVGLPQCDSRTTATQINVSGLAAGMYFVRVTTDRGVVAKPFVKR